MLKNVNSINQKNFVLVTKYHAWTLHHTWPESFCCSHKTQTSLSPTCPLLCMSVSVYAIILPMRLFWLHWPLKKNEESAQGAVVKRPRLFWGWEVGECSFQPRVWFPRGSVKLDSQDAVALSILFSHVLTTNTWSVLFIDTFQRGSGLTNTSLSRSADRLWKSPEEPMLKMPAFLRHSVHPNSFHPKMLTLSLFIHHYFVPKLLTDISMKHKGVLSLIVMSLCFFVFFNTMEVNGNQNCLVINILQNVLCVCTDWGWVNNDRIFIFGWIINLNTNSSRWCRSSKNWSMVYS